MGVWRLQCAFLLISIGVIFSQLISADTATGRVFVDENRNGLADEGEPGLANVRVSNGSDIVTTDADGRYNLTVDDESIIFITKPRDYATPVNHHMIPQFYYIHQPAGSPAGMRYAGLNRPVLYPPPTSRLYPREAKSFEAILFADTQPMTDRELDFIRDDVVKELIGTDAFGMTMGDILFDDLSMFPWFNADRADRRPQRTG